MRVKQFLGASILALLFGSGAVLAAGGVWSDWAEHRDLRELRDNGQTVEGRITQCEDHADKTGRFYRRIDYVYDVNGREYSGTTFRDLGSAGSSASLDRDRWAAVAPGKPIAVRYLAGRPAVHRGKAISEQELEFHWGQAIFLSVVAVFSLLLAVAGLGGAWQAWRGKAA